MPMMKRQVQRRLLTDLRFAAGLAGFAAGIWGQALQGQCAAAAGQEKGPPDVAVVWTLDNTRLIGGHMPTVWGAPQVAEGGPAVRFNGVDDGLVLPVNPIAGWAQFTIEALIEPAASGAAEQRFLHIEDEHGSRALLELRMLEDGRWCLDTFLLSGANRLTLIDRTRLHPAGRWHWVALRYDGRKMAGFVNGAMQAEGDVAIPAFAVGQTSLGVRLNRVFWFKGAIREVRFHPVALAQEQLQRVKAE
jgi:hypothetical protein